LYKKKQGFEKKLPI